VTLKADILDDISSVLSDWDDVIWNAVTYKGIFYNEYEAASLFGGEIESRDPYVQVREADFFTITHASTIVIGGVTYKITAKEPDGLGMMLLRLSKD